METNTWRGAALLAWLAVGLWRLFVCLSLALVPEPPVLALLALAGQAATAIGAAIAIARLRVRLAELFVVAFVACVVLQMGADFLVYGIRSLLEATTGVLLALLLAALGWLALRPASPPARAL